MPRAGKTLEKEPIYIPAADVTIYRVVHHDAFANYTWVFYKREDIYVKLNPARDRLEAVHWPDYLPYPKDETPKE